MATGRIGVTPVLRTRWSKQPTAGTTSLSGLDDNSVSLVYDVGYEAVYRNGVLLSRGNDYTATSGTSITLIDATLTGDIVEVFANDLVPLTDAISKGQFTAKGALLSATAASTPGVLTVGSNDQVLTADSSTATGLKWGTIAASPASASATVTAQQSTTSATFTDLTTSGPAVTLTTGTKALVIVTARAYANDTNACYASFAVSGATTSSATDERGGIWRTGAYYENQFSRAFRMTGLTAGSNTFTMKYHSDSGVNTVTFGNREIIVIDLGS